MGEKTIVVIDNGGGTVKLGFAGESLPRVVSPNLSFKAKGETRYTTGDALLSRDDILSLTIRRPIDKGYLVNVDLQREIWAKLFKQLKINPHQCGLVLTEPVFNLQSIHEDMTKMVLDGFGFASVVMKSAAELAFVQARTIDPDSLSSRAQTGVVVDVGFSFSHIVPICKGEVFKEGIRRIDFGGKAMTNYFKELISFRSLHLMDETYLAEKIKNVLCFVSQDVTSDLSTAKKGTWGSPFYREFVLPDGVTNLHGFVRHEPKADEDMADLMKNKEQALAVNTERFMVPEVLFNPSDIGLEQAGLPEATVESIERAPSYLRPLLYSNIILIGGVAQCPGFAQRMRKELRSLVDDMLEVKVVEVDDPVSCAWKGGSLFGHTTSYKTQCLSKKDFHHRHQQQQPTK